MRQLLQRFDALGLVYLSAIEPPATLSAGHNHDYSLYQFSLGEHYKARLCKDWSKNSAVCTGH